MKINNVGVSARSLEEMILYRRAALEKATPRKRKEICFNFVHNRGLAVQTPDWHKSRAQTRFELDGVWVLL